MSYRLCLRTQPADRAYSNRTYSCAFDSYADASEAAQLLIHMNESHMDGFVTIETDDVAVELEGQWVEVYRSKYRIGNPNFR